MVNSCMIKNNVSAVGIKYQTKVLYKAPYKNEYIYLITKTIN